LPLATTRWSVVLAAGTLLTNGVLGLDDGGLKALVIGGRLRGDRHGRELKFRRAEVARLA